nr:homeodomain transcription factor bW [Moesziomyces parantarcticus]
MNAVQLLQQVTDLIGKVQDTLPQPSAPFQQSGARATARSLDLFTPSEELCLAELSTCSLTTEGKKLMFSFYRKQVTRLQRAYQEKFHDAVAGLEKAGLCDEPFLEDFRVSLRRRFALHCQRMWELVSEEVASHCCQERRSNRADEDNHHGLDSKHSSSVDGKANRGHDSDAVKILEQAFQHTPNITQAEKYRLAEVTGLQPKQVTIWVFQNRRNRKGRKGAKAAKNSHARATAQPQSPNDFASPPRDFTLNEKKRKSYGALGVASSSSSDSESDEGFGFPKKPRLPRAHSGLSDASTSSSAHSASFTTWSSPSSRSTSSSSVSSSPSDCFDSPGKAHNVFRLLNPLKYDAHAKQDMPAVTMRRHRSCRTSASKTDRRSAAMRRTAASMAACRRWNLQARPCSPGWTLAVCSSPVMRSRSWTGARRAARGSATDDDGWVDDDEPRTNATPSPISAGNNVHTKQQDAAVLSQSTHGAMQFSNRVAASAPIPHAAATAAPWAAHAGATSNGDMSNDSALSNSNKEPIDLHHFFESAAQAPAPPSYVPYQQTSPQHPIATADSTPVANPPCLDFEVDMADIEDYLSSFVQPAVPVASPDAEVRAQIAVQQPPEFYLNFDLSPDMFRVA